MTNLVKPRGELLHEAGERLWQACYANADFNAGAPIRIAALKATAGPRSGVLSVDGGAHGDRLHQALTTQKNAKLRAIFPHTWIGADDAIEPEVRFIGRRLTIEANWPEHLQTRLLPFSDIKQRPGNGRSFGLGEDMRGATVTIALGKTASHTLIGGGTGSGKTVTIWTIARQLVQAPGVQFVLVNGKGNRGLGLLNGLPGQVGPMALDISEARNAIGWVYATMMERTLSRAEEFAPVYLIVDEFDVFTMGDSEIARLLFYVVKMGREVSVYVIAATQSPKQRMFGDQNGTRDQFGVRIALSVSDRHASEAVLGATEPRADKLSGSGDAWVQTDDVCTRTLVAFTSPEEAKALGGGEPRLARWPVFESSALTDNSKPGPEAQPFTAQESVVALYMALHEKGRPWVNKQFERLNGRGIGADRFRDKLRPHGEELARLWSELGAEA